MQIIYEPHPVTPERKSELLAAGYKIIDARFAPEGFEVQKPLAKEDREALFREKFPDLAPEPIDKPKRSRKAKA